jgi:hypothetical protein
MAPRMTVSIPRNSSMPGIGKSRLLAPAIQVPSAKASGQASVFSLTPGRCCRKCGDSSTAREFPAHQVYGGADIGVVGPNPSARRCVLRESMTEYRRSRGALATGSGFLATSTSQRPGGTKLIGEWVLTEEAL